MSSAESNETTAATVSCDLAPPPQRRRRRHPPPPPPRNLPFVTLPSELDVRRFVESQPNATQIIFVQIFITAETKNVRA